MSLKIEYMYKRKKQQTNIILFFVLYKFYKIYYIKFIYIILKFILFRNIYYEKLLSLYIYKCDLYIYM